MERLNNKVAIITGASSGMGTTHAELMIAEGAKVVLTDIAEEAGKNLAQKLGDNAVFIKHDVTDLEQWKAVVKFAEEKFGPVNVLVNNAGIGGYIAPDNATEAEYRKIISVNQDGTAFGMMAVLDSMKRSGGGSIVNVSSVAGITGAKGGIAYSGSKFAVRGMTKAVALDMAGYNIRVNSVHPGFVETAILSVLPDEMRDAAKTYIPLGRIAEPKEISYLIVFLASDESSYCTGSEFIVDGGLTSV